VNPHATPYVFPAGQNPALATYLTEKTKHDPATGCLEWTGGVSKHGDPRIWKTYAARFGSDRPSRLAWQLCHGKVLGKNTKLVSTCGNPKCINPDHLKAALPAAPRRVYLPGNGDGEMPPRKWSAHGGLLVVGNHRLDAARVYDMQSRPPPRNPRLGLASTFASDIFLLGTIPSRPLLHRERERLEVIRAVRRCPIRATLTELPNGFRRYDLPAGITEIAFTAPPPPSYEEAFGWQGEPDDVPEAAPEAVWEPTAKAA
jgi:hypothetical protein